MSTSNIETAKDLFDIAGKVFVLAGAGGTVGRRLASLLEKSGARVAAVDVDPRIQDMNTSNPDTGGEVRNYQCDLTDEKGVQEIVRVIADDFGAIDVLINLVCTFGTGKPVLELDYATWKKEMDINLNSMFLTCRYFGEWMTGRGTGCIVNFASTASYFCVKGSPKSGYCVSKSGVLMLTKSLACEWAGSGVRVNAIAPGFIDIRENAITGDTERDLNQKELDRVGIVPLGRMANVIDLFGPIVLLSTKASAYMTGEIVMVDGGHSLSI